MSPLLRHQSPPAPRLRKPGPRGASRPVVREPLYKRLPRPSWRLLFRLLLLILLAGVVYAFYELRTTIEPLIDQPIRRVQVEGDLSYVSTAQVGERILPHTGEKTFFAVDLAALRSDLQAMPWIAEAHVRRVWPDRVIVRLEEQLPVARWGDEALLNNQGKAFVPDELKAYAHLPRLWGPQRAQERVMGQYQLFNRLLRPVGIKVAGLEMRERGSWYLTTDQGFELLLGRDRIVDKMRRFIRVYETTLKEHTSHIARIDLRYPNGLAVAWRDLPAMAVGESTPVAGQRN